MKISLTIHDEPPNRVIEVRPLNQDGTKPGGGPPGGIVWRVRPNQKWRGWRYRRLRNLGDGVHDIVTEAEKDVENADVVSSDDNKVKKSAALF